MAELTPALPASLQKYPDLDNWLRLDPEETVTIFTGKELDVALGRVRVAPTETGSAPNEGTTSGSNSLEMTGSALRVATAKARQLQVNRETGQIRLERAFITADAGQVVNPDGLANQLEGGLVQAASWTLKEAVRFDQQGITSRDW